MTNAIDTLREIITAINKAKSDELIGSLSFQRYNSLDDDNPVMVLGDAQLEDVTYKIRISGKLTTINVCFRESDTETPSRILDVARKYENAIDDASDTSVSIPSLQLMIVPLQYRGKYYLSAYNPIMTLDVRNDTTSDGVPYAYITLCFGTEHVEVQSLADEDVEKINHDVKEKYEREVAVEAAKEALLEETMEG